MDILIRADILTHSGSGWVLLEVKVTLRRSLKTTCIIRVPRQLSYQEGRPLLLGDQANYKHLAVSDGIEAMVDFQQLIQLDLNNPQRAQIRKNLLEYCKQDTLLYTYIIGCLKK